MITHKHVCTVGTHTSRHRNTAFAINVAIVQLVFHEETGQTGVHMVHMVAQVFDLVYIHFVMILLITDCGNSKPCPDMDI